MGGRTFIVAELSANHRQDLSIARQSIEAIAASGADAVKVQTFTPQTITLQSDRAPFRIAADSPWDGSTLYDLYQQAYLPWEWHRQLKELAESLRLEFFSTPFDRSAVDFLETLQVSRYKVASFEITDIPLLEYVARLGKPVLISTGIASLGDIEEAVSACRRSGRPEITLLHCVSSYPATPQQANLVKIPHLAATFGVRSGLSDHSLGSTIPIAAVALGAVVIEKHFTLSRSLGGPDASFSMQPDEFRQMVEAVRDTEDAVGRVTYDLDEKLLKSRSFSRSLFAVASIEPGEPFTSDNVRSIRPAGGLHPRHLHEILGRKARVRIERGTPLSWDLVE